MKVTKEFDTVDEYIKYKKAISKILMSTGKLSKSRAKRVAFDLNSLDLYGTQRPEKSKNSSK